MSLDSYKHHEGAIHEGVCPFMNRHPFPSCTYKSFNDYCMALCINVEHSVPYVHTQNGLAESLIKRIKLIARPLLQNCKLPTSCWGHAVLHVADLIQIRPTAYNTVSPLQLVCENQPSISHLRKFGCVVYVPISPLQCTTMGPHRKLGTYVGINHRQS